MKSLVLKYGILGILLIGLVFFIMQKNFEYIELEKKEKKIIRKIYRAEEDRRNKLYDLEVLKKQNNYYPGSNKVMILKMNQEQ